MVTSTSTGGLSHPAGPSLAQFGVLERCQQGGDCTDRATDAVEAALTRLGAMIDDTAITSNGGVPPEDRLYVEVTRDPQMEWRSETGVEGTSGGVMIDLTDDAPYVVVAPGEAFRLGAADAAAIRDALFVTR